MRRIACIFLVLMAAGFAGPGAVRLRAQGPAKGGAPKMVACPSCGNVLRVGTRTCPKCKVGFNAKCPVCKGDVFLGDPLCRKCGLPLTWPEPPGSKRSASGGKRI